MLGKNLTGEHCARVAAVIRRVARRFRIKLDSTPLGEDLKKVEWMARFKGDSLYQRQLQGAERDRVIEIIPCVARLKRTAWALETASSLRGFIVPLRRIRRLRVVAGAPQGSAKDHDGAGQAWDALYEIESAAQLHVPEGTVSFAEPDLVLNFNRFGLKLGIACKRPRSLRSLSGAIGAAIEQCARFGGESVISLGMDLLLPRHHGAAPNWVHGENDKETRKACRDLMAQASVLASSPIGVAFARAKARDPRLVAGIYGVLLTANVLFLSRESTGRLYINSGLLVEQVPFTDIPNSHPVLAVLAQGLLDGQNTFRMDEAWLEER